MSRDWNGLDLQNEFSALLGDESDTFKSRVLGWINDIQVDICSRNDWGFLKKTGQKKLTASTEEQELFVSAPSAPSVALATGGSLTEGSTYKVVVTFYQSDDDFESIGSVETSGVTATATDKQINVTSIPTSDEPLVTARRIYLIKDDGDPLFNQVISDNTTTTATITSESTSLVQAPDYLAVRQIDGNPFLKESSQLIYKPLDQLRLLFPGDFASGTPDYWAVIDESRIVLYPKPSSEDILFFRYFRLPARLYASKDSEPSIPPYLKLVLKAGVIALGYEYRDRAGQENKRSNYEELLRRAISQMAPTIKLARRVRDVMGDSDGREI